MKTRSAVLKIWSEDLSGVPKAFSGDPQGQNYFRNTETSMPFSLSFSHEWRVGFPGGHATWHVVIALTADSKGACLVLCFKILSVLISNIVNIKRYNPERHKFFGALNTF